LYHQSQLSQTIWHILPDIRHGEPMAHEIHGRAELKLHWSRWVGGRRWMGAKHTANTSTTSTVLNSPALNAL